MSQGQIQTSRGHEVCCSHDHALFPCRVAAAAAAGSTSLAVRGRLVARPSVGGRGDLKRAQEPGQEDRRERWRVVVAMDLVAGTAAGSAGQIGPCTLGRARGARKAAESPKREEHGAQKERVVRVAWRARWVVCTHVDVGENDRVAQ